MLAANGGSYTCSFTANFFGSANSTQTDIVTATVVDPQGATATDSDDAVVSITPATSVPLRTFSARLEEGVVLVWRTASGSDILGFNVYRQQGAKRLKLNPRLLLAKGRGASYSFVYRVPVGAKLPTLLWLQVVEGDGSRTWHGPARIARS